MVSGNLPPGILLISQLSLALFVGTKLGGRPQPLRGIEPSLVPEPRTQITVT